MADEFKINIVTLADLTGIKLTQQQLDALQKSAAKGNAESIAALNKLKAAQTEAAASASEASGAFGLSGTAAGLGTIITLVTFAINRWQQFNDEIDKWVEGMIKAQGKLRELGESIIEMQDKARDAARVGTEPLYQSFIRLQQVIIRLKTEQGLLDLPTQGEEWKKLAASIATAEGQLKGVTNELQQQSAAAAKLAEENAKAAESFMKGAVSTASPQVQATIKTEDEARRAREAGEANTADRLQKKAEAFKRGMTPEQRDEYEGLTKPIRLGPKAGTGESQVALDDIARNKINFERQLRGEPPLPPGDASGNQDLINAINQLRNDLVGIWR